MKQNKPLMEVAVKRVEPKSRTWNDIASAITTQHYLHKMPDPRCSLETYKISLVCDATAIEGVGAFVFGRPQASVCRPWYGSLSEAQTGVCEMTYWQILNLARVWLHPDFQAGGRWYDPAFLPGYFDRNGVFRSTLASEAIRRIADIVGFEYLQYRPPVFLDEPYQIQYLMSYCDANLHKGTIYRMAGFELFRTNNQGIQTWRLRLRDLRQYEHDAIREASRTSARANSYRAQRAQLRLI